MKPLSSENKNESEIKKTYCYHLNCRYVCGSLEYYEKSYDRVTTKNEVPLAGVNRIFHKVTTTDDPIIRKVCCFYAALFVPVQPSFHQAKFTNTNTVWTKRRLLRRHSATFQ